MISNGSDVAVIGLGYVGLPLAVSLAECGYFVRGIDVKSRLKEILETEEFGKNISTNLVPNLKKVLKKIGRAHV